MSNSAAYRWTYVDVEAERRRELRAQLARETARSRDLHAQAKALRRVHRTARVDVPVVTANSQGGSAELAQALESARRNNDRAEAELSRAAARVWSAPPEETEPARPAPTRPTGPSAADIAADKARRASAAREAALAEAEALLERDGSACDPADLPVFARRLEALRQAGTAETARTLLTDLGVLVHRSAVRRRRAARAAELRATLLEHLEDASPEDRHRLTPLVTDAPEPSDLADDVARAVTRETTARNRTTVADTLMEVLRERDYAVGDDFADLLAEDGSVVVPFGPSGMTEGDPTDAGSDPGRDGTGMLDGTGMPERTGMPEGYGLRITLAADRTGLTTALVRAPAAGSDGGADAWVETDAEAGAETDAEADARIQRWFCDEQLPKLEDAIRGRGVALDRTAVMPPGVRPTAEAPDASWPDRADDAPGKGQHKDRTAPKPKAKPRKSSTSTWSTRNQERQRGR
ncbi:hypothetical protein [Streptomyces sp. WAC01280]|uniref:hypothetical protein n=1 Tax=Streptomyces sp. WAC01280 TaxID=2487424 RepID=UPI00163C8376|nr:hypothetical protein [Streptomyces sp. WAC01280]